MDCSTYTVIEGFMGVSEGIMLMFKFFVDHDLLMKWVNEDYLEGGMISFEKRVPNIRKLVALSGKTMYISAPPFLSARAIDWLPTLDDDDDDSRKCCHLCKSFQMIRLACRHVFHKECVSQHLSNRSCCPTCQAPVYAVEMREENVQPNLTVTVPPETTMSPETTIPPETTNPS